MSVTKHTGSSIPTAPESFDPNDKRWVWFSWPSAVLSSEFILPDGWTAHAEQTAKDVIGDDGRRYKNSNGVLLSTTARSGNHTITNRVLVGTEQQDRSVVLEVRSN